MISSDDAFLMLTKWHEDKHPLKLLIAGEGFNIGLGGVIEEIEGSRLAFFPIEPNDCEGEAIFELSECKFEYGDSREAPPGSISARRFSSILTILRPDGIRLMFGERRL